MCAMPVSPESANDGYSEVLYYLDWWDCPRSGVFLLDGQPTHFACPFSEELDDYPAEFLLWPATETEVAVGIAHFERFAEWRGRFDRGEVEAGFDGGPWTPITPAGSSMRAVPDWRLDPDRSFASKVPRHWVRWSFLDED